MSVAGTFHMAKSQIGFKVSFTIFGKNLGGSFLISIFFQFRPTLIDMTMASGKFGVGVIKKLCQEVLDGEGVPKERKK